MPLGFGCKPADQRPIDQPADDRHQYDEPHSEKRDVRVSHPTDPAVVSVAAEHLGESHHHLAKRDRPHAGSHPHQSTKHHQPRLATPQPPHDPGAPIVLNARLGLDSRRTDACFLCVVYRWCEIG